MELLNKMLLGFTALNKSDPKLNQVAEKIKELLIAPQVDADYILQLITNAKEIVESYGVQPISDKPTDDPISGLPGIFYTIMEELDHLATTQRVMDKLSGKTRREEIKIKLAAFHRALLK